MPSVLITGAGVGGIDVADALVPAVGQLSRPSTPDIPRANSFGGTSFHSVPA